MFYRKTDQGKCDCKLMYEGDEDFILRIGGSSEVKNKNRSVHLITYSLLFDFTLDFFENGTTITGFYKTYHAKCKLNYGMAADNIITLDSWKMAVRIFWKEILKVDMCKSFLCQNCGNLPPTIVFDGIALGCQIKKVKAFQDKMSLVLDRRSKSKLLRKNLHQIQKKSRPFEAFGRQKRMASYRPYKANLYCKGRNRYDQAHEDD